MTAWRLIKERPTQAATFVRVCLLAFVAFGVTLSQEQIAALIAVVESFLALFQYSNTLPMTEVNKQVDIKVAHREAATLAELNNLGSLNGIPNNRPSPYTRR